MVRNTMNRSKRVNRIMKEHWTPGESQMSVGAVKDMLTQMYNEAFEDGVEQGKQDEAEMWLGVHK